MSLKPKTPAEMLRRAARWVIENADELVAGDGVYVIEDGLDLYVTIHLQSCNFTTVTVDGHTNYIVLDAADMLDENAKLRELVQSYHSAMLCMLETGIWPTDPEWLEHRMSELGIEVDG